MDGYRRLVRSCVRVQTKAENNNNMDHVVIKMTNLVSPMFSILKVSSRGSTGFPIPLCREVSSCFVLGVPLPCLGSS